MKPELIHVLTNLQEPEKMDTFIKSLSLEELETIVHLLEYVQTSIKENWEKII